jgi:sporulation protein YlmC with PRC-barrel domain
MEISASIRCSELKKRDVVDSKGRKIGHIGDLTFTFDKTLKLSQFVLAGPAWDEILESTRTRPNQDPVFAATLIKKMGDKVYLGSTASSLKESIDKGAVKSNEIRFSKLEKLEILDKDGAHVGHAVDVHFDSDGSASLIVGGSFMEEHLESAGIKRDIDIIVPATTIASIGDKVRLMVSKEVLGKTVSDALKRKEPEAKKAKEAKEVQRDVTKVRFFTQRPS